MSESLYDIKHIAESDLSESTAKDVQSLLQRNFPWTKEFESQPYWHVRPQSRFLAYPVDSEDLVGHIALFERDVKVSKTILKLAGLGLYAVDKMHRGSDASTGLVYGSHKVIYERDYDAVVVFTKHGIVRKNFQGIGYVAVPDLFQFTYPDGGLVTKNDSFVLPIKPNVLALLNSVGTVYTGVGTW